MLKFIWNRVWSLIRGILAGIKVIIDLVKFLLHLLWRGVLNILSMATQLLSDTGIVTAAGLHAGWVACKKYALPIAVGGAVCYYAPAIGCAIAAIPVIRWIDRKLHMTPAMKVLVTVGIFILIERVFFAAPLLVYFLAIFAVGRDFQEWKRRIHEWGQQMYDRGLKALKDGKEALATVAA